MMWFVAQLLILWVVVAFPLGCFVGAWMRVGGSND